jgi:hypothetical protein
VTVVSVANGGPWTGRSSAEAFVKSIVRIADKYPKPVLRNTNDSRTCCQDADLVSCGAHETTGRA